MNYEKKYKEIVGEIRKAYLYAQTDSTKAVLEEILPELAESESEDEKIRKRLITDFGTIGKKEWGGLEVKDILSWLERQGEHANFRNRIQVGDKVTRNEAGILVNLSQLKRVAKPREKQGEQKPIEMKTAEKSLGIDSDTYNKIVDECIFGEQEPNPCDGCINRKGCINCENGELREKEQKPADTVEPKFKAGEWIVFNGLPLYIKEVVKGYYRTISEGGIPNSLDWDVDKLARLWTIQEAKDGDVLSYVTDEGDSWIMIYKSLYKPYEGHVHYHALLVNNDFTDGGTCCISIEDLTPTTKEQRDTLLKAMANAGYTFDFEKKELKKIEPKTEENKGNLGGISSNWSEEDEKNLRRAIRATKVVYPVAADWLKSLRPQNHWKPSVEQMEALWFYAEQNNYDGAVLTSLYNDLKKLKEENI